MELSAELISQFAKITNDNKSDKKTETTMFGTVKLYDGAYYVQLDGSDLLTPVTTTTDVAEGERVTVMIKDHSATVTGNVSSPSARTDDVKEVGDKVEEIGKQITEFETVVADKVTTTDLQAINASIESLRAKTANITNADIVNAEIDNLQAKYAELEYVDAKTIEALNADIENLRVTFGEFTDISTEDLEAINADIDNLKAYNAEFTYVSAEVLSAFKADIKELDTKKLSAEQADLKYANIDFTNINQAAVQKIFSDSGIIKDLIVSEGKITGELVGVTIKGDLIEGNTIKADKLVVKGSDGLYYKLNFESGNFSDGEAIPTDGIHGSVIVAESITAEKIAVDDLVAFGATIGGFNITTNSLYSGVKESVDNTTKGVYLDDSGQMALGDSTNYLRYYKDAEGKYHLEISASSLIFSSTNKSVEESITEVQNGMDAAVENIDGRITSSESTAQTIVDNIANLITDENGESLMTQVGDNWTFSTGGIQSSVNNLSDLLDELTIEYGSVESAVTVLQQAVGDITTKTDYVNIGTYTYTNNAGETLTEPCIELGESENEYKVLITNTQILFKVGSNIPTRITADGLVSENVTIEEELRLINRAAPGYYYVKSSAEGRISVYWKGSDV